MQHQRHIQLYEHESIRIGEARNGCTFTESDWNQLLQLNEHQYPPYLQALHRGIRTLNFVGMIQLPGLCLEILPKTDRDLAANNRYLLLEMLIRSKKIPVIPQTNHLASNEGSLGDHFLMQFLEEVEHLCRKGLTKKYRKQTANFNRFRGRMQLKEQIRKNHAHKEKIYAEYQAFDTEHHLHDILRIALNSIRHLSRHNEILKRSRQLLAHLPQNSYRDKLLGERKSILFTRQDQHYKPAIDWANFILDKMEPRLQPGSLKCSAFLFDMQQLFEEVVAQEIKCATKKMGCSLQIQPSRHFWRQRKIRPDMVLKTQDVDNIILDTKWKMLKNGQPDEADLKQMYIYNRFFQAKRGILIYPSQGKNLSWGEKYCEGKKNSLRCDLLFVNLMDSGSGRFNTHLGQEILQQILSLEIQSV